MLLIKEKFPEFVLPVKLDNKFGNELERLDIQRICFRRFLPEAKIWIVASGNDIVQIKNEFGVEENYHYLDEKDVLRKKHNCGWWTQQMIKLAASDFVGSPFYITLDSDIFFCRTPKITEFVKNNKGLVNIFIKDILKNSIGLTLNKKWSDETGDFLNLPKLEEIWSLTPLVYSKFAWKDILLTLEEYWGEDWQSKLSNNESWYEHTVYQYMLEKLNIFNKFHEKIDYHQCDWIQSLLNFKEDLFSEKSKHTMICVNSAVGIYPGYIKKMLSNFGIS